MGIGEAITKFFHDMGILELRIHNEHPAYAKLSYNSSLYLDIISAHQGEYTPSKLADMLHITRPSVTQKINVLEKAGYVTRNSPKCFPTSGKFVLMNAYERSTICNTTYKKDIFPLCSARTFSHGGIVHLYDDRRHFRGTIHRQPRTGGGKLSLSRHYDSLCRRGYGGGRLLCQNRPFIGPRKK